MGSIVGGLGSKLALNFPCVKAIGSNKVPGAEATIEFFAPRLCLAAFTYAKSKEFFIFFCDFHQTMTDH